MRKPLPLRRVTSPSLKLKPPPPTRRPMSNVRDKRYFLSKAEQCFRLADGILDREMVFRLRELGYEFVEQALQWGADPAGIPNVGADPRSRIAKNLLQSN